MNLIVFSAIAAAFLMKERSTASCGKNTFQCKKFNQCVKLTNVCDQKVDCFDGSDESYQSCSEKHYKSNNRTCKLPPKPRNGYYKALQESTCQGSAGSEVPSECTIRYQCSPGFRLIGSSDVICSSGFWSPGLPHCSNQCEPLLSKKLTITCRNGGSKLISCKKPVPNNSNAVFHCNSSTYVQIKEPDYSYIVCLNGNWNKPLTDNFCQPICGKPLSHFAEAVISNGTQTEFGQFPWHAGIYIYEPNLSKYEQKCGGTLISKQVVITAAHCVVYEKRGQRGIFKRDEASLKIGLGKFYRDLDAKEDYAQIKDVLSYEIPLDYIGGQSVYLDDIAFIVLTTEVDYSLTVRPVCIDNNEENQLIEGAIGKVAGWGLTDQSISSNSKTLLSATLPFVPRKVCREKIVRYLSQYLLKDKICAGDKNSSVNVCSGDSGGGYVVEDKNMKSYFLRGVVSLGTNECKGREYALFTRITPFKDYVDKYLSLSTSNSQLLSLKLYSDGKSCKLPSKPLNGFYSSYLCEDDSLCIGRVGTEVESGFSLHYQCFKSFILKGAPDVICSSGTWYPELPHCSDECEPLTSKKLLITCKSDDGKRIPCNKPVPTNTFASFSCNSFSHVQVKEPNYRRIACINGEWDKPLIDDFCQPVCGQSLAHLSQFLASNGKQVEFGKFPWNAGIYVSSNSYPNPDEKLVCGGTLISTKIVITAANCIYKQFGKEYVRYNEYSLKVALGKYYRDLDVKDDVLAQTREVASIVTIPEYERDIPTKPDGIALLVLEKEVEYSLAIMPACVDNNGGSRLIKDDIGHVAGWQNTTQEGASETLKFVTMHYIPSNECDKKISRYFRPYLANDKICAGDQNSTTNICSILPGSGYVVEDRKTKAYYLQGIYNFAPNCEKEKYMYFTKLPPLRDYLNSSTSEDRIIFREHQINHTTCKLPPKPTNGNYKSYLCEHNSSCLGSVDSEVKSGFSLHYECSDGFRLMGHPDVICSSGEWYPELPQCTNGCELLRSKKLWITYTDENSTRTCTSEGTDEEGTDCYGPMPHNSHATYICYVPHYIKVKEPEYTKIHCSNGFWDQPLNDDFCAFSCGIVSSETELSTLRQLPWHAGIYFYNQKASKYELICEGTLISDKVVVTAAHCLYYLNVTQRGTLKGEKLALKVGVGLFRKDLEATENEYSAIQDVESYETVPEYDGSASIYMNDIAFLVLKSKIHISEVILPVCIDVDHNDEHQFKEGAIGEFLGWGLNKEGISSDSLLYAGLPYLSRDECQEKIPHSLKQYLTNDKICVGTDHSNASLCSGGSGSGLVFRDEKRYYLRGIVSLGVRNCNGLDYVLATRLSSFKDYVDKYLNLSNGESCRLPRKPYNGDYISYKCKEDSSCIGEVGSEVPQGFSLHFKCLPGFRLTGLSDITCKSGTWNPVPPRCKQE